MRSPTRSPLVAAAGCWIAFAAALACAYAIGPIGRWDANALHGLMALNGPVFARLGPLVVHLVDPLPLIVMLGALFAWGWALGRRRQAVAAVAMAAAANVTALALKVALAHPRFYPVLGANQVGAEAYPSGHAASVMSLGLAAILVAPARIRVGVACAAAAFVIAVSTSLLVLSWHLPSDVFGGLLVASAFFFCAVAALRAGAGRAAGVAARGRVRLALSPGLGAVAVGGLAGASLIALSRTEELLAFARVHTTATATALAIVAISVGLLASATVVSDP